MRVNEFAKLYALTSKQILDVLKAEKIVLSGPTAVLSEKMQALVKKALVRPEKAASPVKKGAVKKVTTTKAKVEKAPLKKTTTKKATVTKVAVKKVSAPITKAVKAPVKKTGVKKVEPVKSQVKKIEPPKVEAIKAKVEVIEPVKVEIKKVEVIKATEIKAEVKKEQAVSSVPARETKEVINVDVNRKTVMHKEFSKSSPKTKIQQAPSYEKVEKKPVVIEKKDPLVVQSMTVGDFAERTGVPVTEAIITLLKQGKVCAKNQLLAEPVVYELCRHYEIETIAPVAPQKKEVLSGSLSLSTENQKKRPPVVVIMGHVDHGKTTLLDYIRKTRVAAKEKGGITQHLGAYKVESPQGDIVFLDTPGHEAFSKIRKRGASVADIAILVVAADDGIMPQTVECIKAIKALNMLVIVAMNKVDKVDAQRLEIVKRQLTQYELLPEEWGGDVVCIPISGKEGTGVDQLLEMILLQAEMLELQGSDSASAQGYVLESRMIQGRGAVATVLCRQGVLRIGDFFNAGEVVGKVTAITDSFGKNLTMADPSTPVLVAGFSALPSVGALFTVVKEEDYKKSKIVSAEKVHTFTPQATTSADAQKFNVIIKADTHSSLEAILDAIKKIAKADTKDIVILHAGIGNISESDALLAKNSNAQLIAFSVKPEHNAATFLKNSKLKVHFFDIIYKLLDELTVMASREKEIHHVLTKIGEALVLKIFNIKKLGVIAGCVVKDGRFSAKGIIAIMRDKKEVARGKIKSLQRDKKSVKEVHSGFECAFIVEGFEEWQEGDTALCYLDQLV